MELEKDKLLQLYPTYTSVLGPYERPDGRKHVILNNSNLPSGTKGKRKTISYPKALVESIDGRRLLPNETVDHNDRDKTNNSKQNLIIRDRSTHSSIDAIRVKTEALTCPQCGREFEATVNQRNHPGIKNGRMVAGPFCSKQCAGKYGKNVQDGGKVMGRQEIVKTYYRIDK